MAKKIYSSFTDKNGTRYGFTNYADFASFWFNMSRATAKRLFPTTFDKLQRCAANSKEARTPVPSTKPTITFYVVDENAIAYTSADMAEGRAVVLHASGLRHSQHKDGDIISLTHRKQFRLASEQDFHDYSLHFPDCYRKGESDAYRYVIDVTPMAIPAKSAACSRVLQLMDEDKSYSRALQIVMEENDIKCSYELQKELTYYI